MTGLFIAFEGIDGSGKTTQAGMLFETMQEVGRKVVFTRFPNNDPDGPQIATRLYGEKKFNHKVWALLHAADRAHHVEETIYPFLQSGYSVVCDRYMESSIAYQVGGQRLDEEVVERMTNFSAAGVVPDITFLIDVPLAVAEDRVKSRGTDTWFDEPFLERVRSKYLERASRNESIVVINGIGSPLEISREIWSEVRELLPWY